MDEYIKMTSDIISSIESENKKEIEKEYDDIQNDLTKFENFIENSMNLADEITIDINSFDMNIIHENIANYHENIEPTTENINIDNDFEIDINIDDFMENNNSNDYNINDEDKIHSVEFEQTQLTIETETFFKEVCENNELDKEDNTIIHEKIDSVDVVDSVQLYEISIIEQKQDLDNMNKPIDEILESIKLDFEQEDNITTSQIHDILIPNLEQEQEDEKEDEQKTIEDIVNTVHLEQEDNTSIETKVDVIEEKDIEKENNDILDIVNTVNIQLEQLENTEQQ
jgi:hypothetical protein